MMLFPSPFKALVIGSSGTIGQAFLKLLSEHPACKHVIGIHRHSVPPINYLEPDSIELAAKELLSEGPFQLIINTTGVLHTDKFMPEKKLDDLNAEHMMELMKINAIGPALTIRHFSKLLDPKHSMMVNLSAKVGSIEDNRLGGWYSYRASKAALNMLIKTSSIEYARILPNTAIVALHPGTVNSKLSKPFRGEQIGRTADAAVKDMFHVIEHLTKEDTGHFFSYTGDKLPW
jgi:NAD(P)-dependent dehydrogenase (short-subunit alcohol dehydrogenase family)